MKLTTFALASGLALSAGMSQASIISDDSNPLSANTNFNLAVLGLQKFDSSLGTLTKATIVLSGGAEGRIRTESLDAAPSTVVGTLKSRIALTTGLTGAPTAINPEQSKIFNFTAFDGTIDFAGTSGGDTGDVKGGSFATSSFETTDATDLLFLTGTGDIAGFAISANGQSSATGAGNLISLIDTRAIARVHIDYVYDPATSQVPEPGSLALLGLGLAGLGALRRKRS